MDVFSILIDKDAFAPHREIADNRFDVDSNNPYVVNGGVKFYSFVVLLPLKLEYLLQLF